MNQPTFFPSRALTSDVHIFPSYFPIPGMGMLPVNAYLIRSTEPVLVDTGLPALRTEFMRSLSEVIEPSSLRWIYLTHMDPDHTGSLVEVLRAAPFARVVTTFLGMGKMMLQMLPLDRVYLLNPGQALNVGDRELIALVPPIFDAPETTAVFDQKSRTLFSSDCFGALMSNPAHSALEIPAAELKQNMITWATIDAPWLERLDRRFFEESLEGIQSLGATTVLGSHLPPATGMIGQLLDIVRLAPSAPGFLGPDQKALENMMKAA